ncbi:helix-turn-helix domain-containing protein [Streptomyces sparsus]
MAARILEIVPGGIRADRNIETLRPEHRFAERQLADPVTALGCHPTSNTMPSRIKRAHRRCDLGDIGDIGGIVVIAEALLASTRALLQEAERTLTRRVQHR